MASAIEGSGAAHRHAWSVVDFGVDDDRPVVRQACACGAERVVPAWDRTWTPPIAWRLVADGPLAGRLMHASAAVGKPMSAAIQVDVWSDIACPWCYIGKRNLETGLAAYRADAEAVPVEITYHSFELDPDAPTDFDGTADDYLVQRKGIDPVQAAAMHERVTEMAAAAGLRYDFATVRQTGTTRAHQLTHYARERGLGREAVERLFAAHFSEGRHVGREEDLADLAAEIGLDAADVLRSLRANEYLDAVHADERQAAAYGIRGVPFYVLDGRHGLSGAQPPEVFASALRQVAAERETESATT